MNEEDFDINKLDAKELEFYKKIKGLTDQAYKAGFMEGVRCAVEDSKSDNPRVRRIYVKPSMMLAILIIVLGGIFSFGMYIGGLNG
jgi:hypothetical protein